MSAIHLPDVTLFGISSNNFDGLVLAADICQRELRFGAAKLVTHLRDTGHPDVVVIDHALDYAAFKRFVIGGLADHVETSHVLRFEPDGFVLNASAWSDEFLEYDYIGAVWDHIRDERRVGNGGFSLRSRRLMQAVQADYHARGGGLVRSEDLLICRALRHELERQGMRFAPEVIARRFSVEGEREPWSGQFGFHSLRRTDISAWPERGRYQISADGKSLSPIASSEASMIASV